VWRGTDLGPRGGDCVTGIERSTVARLGQWYSSVRGSEEQLRLELEWMLKFSGQGGARGGRNGTEGGWGPVVDGEHLGDGEAVDLGSLRGGAWR
jgi:hypothetical protein